MKFIENLISPFCLIQIGIIVLMLVTIIVTEFIKTGLVYKYEKEIFIFKVIFLFLNLCFLVYYTVDHHFYKVVQFIVPTILWAIYAGSQIGHNARFLTIVPESTIKSGPIPVLDDSYQEIKQDENGTIDTVEIIPGYYLLSWEIYSPGDEKPGDHGSEKSEGAFVGFDSKRKVLKITNENKALTFPLDGGFEIAFGFMSIFLSTDIEYADQLNVFSLEEFMETIREEGLDTLGLKVSGKKPEDLDNALKVKKLLEAEENGILSLADQLNEDLKKVNIRYYKVDKVRIDKPINDPRYIKAKGAETENTYINKAEKIRIKGQIANAKLIGDKEQIEKIRVLLAAQGLSESYFGLDDTAKYFEIESRKSRK